MPQNYAPEFKKKIVRLHEEEGQSYKSITVEYAVSNAAISAWCKQFREECQISQKQKKQLLKQVAEWICRYSIPQIQISGFLRQWEPPVFSGEGTVPDTRKACPQCLWPQK